MTHRGPFQPGTFCDLLPWWLRIPLVQPPFYSLTSDELSSAVCCHARPRRRALASLSCWEAGVKRGPCKLGTVRAVQSGEKMAVGRPYWGLPVLKGGW